MKKINPTLLEFHAAITKVADDFVERYKIKYPQSTRSIDTILEFINDIDVPFRSKVAAIAVDLLQHQCLDDETRQLFFEKNSCSLSMLFTGLLHTTAPNKETGTPVLSFPALPAPGCGEFEQLKETFIARTTKHIEAIKNLSFEHICDVATGRKLLDARSGAMTSLLHIYEFINTKRYTAIDEQLHTNDITTHSTR